MAQTPREVEVDVVSAPIAVKVVRPKQTWAEVIVTLITGALVSAAVAWVLMLIAGEVTSLGLSYTDTLLSLVAIRLLQSGSGYKLWTHRAKGSAL